MDKKDRQNSDQRYEDFQLSSVPPGKAASNLHSREIETISGAGCKQTSLSNTAENSIYIREPLS
jgi:hypothetical protein